MITFQRVPRTAPVSSFPAMPGSAHTLQGKTQAAFTLIEAAVALSIAAIMLIALYAAFASGFAMVKLSRENLRATQIILTKIESFRVRPWSQVTNSVYTEYFDPKDQSSGGGGVPYTVTCAVNPATGMPSAYSSNMVLVTVGVSWTSGTRQRTNSM